MHLCAEHDLDITQKGEYLGQILNIAETEYRTYFSMYYNDMRRRKLGFKKFSGEKDGALWTDLLSLMYS